MMLMCRNVRAEVPTERRWIQCSFTALLWSFVLCNLWHEYSESMAKPTKPNKREARVSKEAKNGAAPKLSKGKDTFGKQTPSGRIVLESGGVVSPFGKAYCKAQGETFRPRTSPGINDLSATPQWT